MANPSDRRETRHMVENPDLIAKIEVRGRLIEDQDGRLLDQGAGQQRQLPFAAADFGARTMAQMGDGQGLQRLFAQLHVMAGRGPEKAEMGGPAHGDHIDDAKGKSRHMSLRHIADHGREFLLGHDRTSCPIRKNPPFAYGQQAQQRLEQRGLADAVRPQKAKEFARRQR